MLGKSAEEVWGRHIWTNERLRSINQQKWLHAHLCLLMSKGRKDATHR